MALTARDNARSGLLSHPRLADIEIGRDNNLNLIRFLLASLVILSHSYVLLGRFSDEPMQRWLGFNDLGGTAVLSFFFLSGYLIFKSALLSTPQRFVRARILRIFPALATVTLLCTFVLGPLVTQLGPLDYFTSLGTWRYLSTAVLMLGDMRLPGVFVHATEAVVNQPLWTLPGEWTMYMIMLCICAVVTLRRDRRLAPASRIAVAVALLYSLLLMPLPWAHALKWMAFAALGACCYLGRRWIPLSVPLMLALAATDIVTLLGIPVLGKALFPFALAYMLLVIGFHPALHFRAMHRVGDYSYGLYVYAWPFQQLFAPHCPTPMSLFLACYPITLTMAILSWHFIEAPSLKRKWGRRPSPEPALQPLDASTPDLGQLNFDKEDA